MYTSRIDTLAQYCRVTYIGVVKVRYEIKLVRTHAISVRSLKTVFNYIYYHLYSRIRRYKLEGIIIIQKQAAAAEQYLRSYSSCISRLYAISSRTDH